MESIRDLRIQRGGKETPMFVTYIIACLIGGDSCNIIVDERGPYRDLQSCKIRSVEMRKSLIKLVGDGKYSFSYECMNVDIETSMTTFQTRLS